MYYIYKMIHIPSGRVYIGQHKLPKGKTPENDGYNGMGVIWRGIYNKHKNECIKVVIDFTDSKKIVDELEKKYIAHYKSVYGEFCVNIAPGGEGGFTCNHSIDTKYKISESKKGKSRSKETRAKMSESMKGRIPWNKGKINVYSEETRAKMSKAKSNENNPFFGKHHSKESCAKISKAAKSRYK